MYCMYCGKSLVDDSVFCSFCGRQLTVKAEPKVVTATRAYFDEIKNSHSSAMLNVTTEQNLFNDAVTYLRMIIVNGDERNVERLRNLYSNNERIPSYIDDDFRHAHLRTERPMGRFEIAVAPGVFDLNGGMGHFEYTTGWHCTDDFSILAEELIKHKYIPFYSDFNRNASSLAKAHDNELLDCERRAHSFFFHSKCSLQSARRTVFDVIDDSNFFIDVVDYHTREGSFRFYEWAWYKSDVIAPINTLAGLNIGREKYMKAAKEILDFYESSVDDADW